MSMGRTLDSSSQTRGTPTGAEAHRSAPRTSPGERGRCYGGVVTTETDSSHASFWPRLLVALVLIAGAIAFIAVLLFGGGQVSQCLGLGGCPGVVRAVPGPLPFIGTQDGAMVILWAVGVTWFVVALATIRFVWSTDPARLRRAGVGLISLAGATVVVVAAVGLVDGRRLRSVAEEAVLFGVIAGVLAIPVVLSWAILTVRPSRPVSTR